MLSPIKIGINAVYLDPNRRGGAETYVRQLVNQLITRPTVELERLQFVLFVSQDSEFINHPGLRNQSRIELVVTPVQANKKFQRIGWEQVYFPRLLNQHQLELMHFPYGTMSVRYKRASIVTVHDTLRFCFPEQMPRSQRLYRSWNERALRRNNVHAIAVSHADAQIAREQLKIPPDRMSVIYHGVNPEFGELNRASTGRWTEKLTAPQLLWIGRPYIRKNVELLIRVVHQLEAIFGLQPQLKLVGIESADRRRMEKQIERTDAAELIELSPPVPHREVPELLRQADFFLYPSLYESFGIPVLEALAIGLPTICADIAPFRELYGDGIITCSGSSPNAWAKVIKELCDQPEQRQQLSERGVRRAAEFSWKKCIDEHLELYQRLTCPKEYESQ
ncbi:D-inositol 3-phosphate glycosyltransferase [Polystyrenella longa]|uniref:D-inositol 3-phosphate glycosyltransferase n=1 Tax=Polystyrenella longa TaxID=2528007 RepID=A0A518CRS7_9PLAN|nr:glycosyltransferase family 1 protein [Polystyrenella longa]QDU81918.1 D-inositol 3-phosphate glycosyltransferase [Polystyrenella longa]